MRRRRRPLSMTPLIDVIFLLLLFFMLSSTFSRFADVELMTAGAGGAADAGTPLFLQLREDRLSLNGEDRPLEALEGAFASVDRPAVVIVNVARDVSSQRLTDLLVVLNTLDGIGVQVLVPS
ncbi:biopolymer transporter ExbD [Aestuariibius sp. 2305UL40-4]|uniref:biopolymer transporter ExbD n=1 Tax=Aestuariibius violaceus TaxID=3234132 RepID=UPI00345E1F90